MTDDVYLSSNVANRGHSTEGEQPNEPSYDQQFDEVTISVPDFPRCKTSLSVKSCRDMDETVIPDGGWGWVVVLSSFLIHVIADGIVYSFGVFVVALLEEFGGTRGETGWVASLIPGITLSSGPIASALTNKYGCRTSTFIGSIIAASGFILSVFAPHLYFLYFSFGILSGLGFGLVYLPAIVSVTQYFEKKRAFATGLAVCGAGIGTFAFAPFSQYLLDTYGWRGAVLIEAGIILQCIICGATFRSLKFTDSNIKAHERNRIADDNQCPDKRQNLEPLITAFDESNTSKRILTSTALLSRSTLEVPTHYKSSHSLHSGVLSRPDTFYCGSVYSIHSIKDESNYKTNQEPSTVKQSSIFLCRYFSPEVREMLSEMLDLRLLKNPIFVIFAISNFFTSIGFNMPFIYLPDRAKSLGIRKDRAALVISCIGIANTFGRILFGWLADRTWVNRIYLYNTALVICGIATAISPLANTFPTLSIYACIFGLFIGVYVSLTSVVLVDLLGLDKLTNSFGLLLLFQGVATFIGPPIAGWLFDASGSYTMSFILEGCLIAVSGLMLYIIPVLKRKLDQRTNH